MCCRVLQVFDEHFGPNKHVFYLVVLTRVVLTCRAAELMFESYKVPALFVAKNAVWFCPSVLTNKQSPFPLDVSLLCFLVVYMDWALLLIFLGTENGTSRFLPLFLLDVLHLWLLTGKPAPNIIYFCIFSSSIDSLQIYWSILIIDMLVSRSVHLEILIAFSQVTNVF